MKERADADRLLLQHARSMLSERCWSLEKDVAVCLAGDAAFPALLYCFATIDLLALLEAGKLQQKKLAKQSRHYMCKWMHYTDEQAKRLQEIFRHKLVHQAGPKPLHFDQKMRIGWKYVHGDHPDHLATLPLPKREPVNIPALGRTLEYDSIFTISISRLVRDICDSVRGPSGYLASLERDDGLLRNFRVALEEIFKNAKPPSPKPSV